jgi:hypothetical protein
MRINNGKNGKDRLMNTRNWFNPRGNTVIGDGFGLFRADFDEDATFAEIVRDWLSKHGGDPDAPPIGEWQTGLVCFGNELKKFWWQILSTGAQDGVFQFQPPDDPQADKLQWTYNPDANDD